MLKSIKAAIRDDSGLSFWYYARKSIRTRMCYLTTSHHSNLASL